MGPENKIKKLTELIDKLEILRFRYIESIITKDEKHLNKLRTEIKEILEELNKIPVSLLNEGLVERLIEDVTDFYNDPLLHPSVVVLVKNLQKVVYKGQKKN